MTPSTSAGPKPASSAGRKTTPIVEQGDGRPVDARLLKRLLDRAGDYAASRCSDSAVLTCTHSDVDDNANFCRCGALLSLDCVLYTVTRIHGVAFALQQMLRGAAIATFQRAERERRAADEVA